MAIGHYDNQAPGAEPNPQQEQPAGLGMRQFETTGNLWAGIHALAPEVLADPFHAERVAPATEETTPVAEASAETPAPDTIPAPATEHPDTLSEAAGYPRHRRCPE